MELAFQNFNFITFMTQLIHYIKVRLGFCKLHHMWWGNKYLELQEWKYFIKSNKTGILYIIMLFTNKNPQGYK